MYPRYLLALLDKESDEDEKSPKWPHLLKKPPPKCLEIENKTVTL